MGTKYDIAIIGSGTGGFTAAIRAAQLGAKVALIEKSLIGGTCLNCGCIPTKFLWQALKTKQKIQKSYEYGFKASLEPVLYSDIVSKKDRNISNIRKGMEMILSSYPIDFIKGTANFKSSNDIEIFTEEKKEIISAEKIIIASGTKPASIKGLDFDGDKVISSTDALNLTEIPKDLLVIGGGAIGIEMAVIFSGFGSKVVLAEYFERILPSEDFEISQEIKKNMQRQGIEVITDCKNAVEMAENFDKVLIAAGRSADIGLNIQDISIETYKNGFIKTNEYCQTNIENIYAVGDIAGKNLLAYTAQNEGAISAENALKGNKIKADNTVIPQAVFALPPSASVKVSNFDEYKNILYGKFPFTASGRAFIEGERSGFIKCAVDGDTGKPLGFWIIGAQSDEIINMASMILKSNINTISRESIFHPSLSEGLLNAYEDAFGKCTEIIKRK